MKKTFSENRKRSDARFRKSEAAIGYGLAEASAAATLAATTIAATSATATTSAAETTAAAGAGGTVFAGTGFVHPKGAALNGAVVQSVDRFSSAIILHFHKAEAFGTLGVSVKNDLCGLYRAELCEQVFKFSVGHGIGQIAHVYVYHLLQLSKASSIKEISSTLDAKKKGETGPLDKMAPQVENILTRPIWESNAEFTQLFKASSSLYG